MAPTCRRPGCGRTAAVAIRYDPVSCQLWLDPVGPDDRHGQLLCLDHAERLSPPRGWVVVDRRGAQTAIRTAEPAVSIPRMPPRRAARRQWGSFEEPTLEFTGSDHAVGRSDTTVLDRPPADEVELELEVEVEVEADVEVAEHVEDEVAERFEVEVEVEVAERFEVEPDGARAEPPPVPPEAGRGSSVSVQIAEPAPAPEVVAQPAAEPAPERAEPELAPAAEAVVAAPADDLTQLLKPRGGLLGRAFEATGDQRSALTLSDEE